MFGDIDVRHPLLLSILESKAFKRLEDIDQHGTSFQGLPTFSRASHSLAFFYAVRKFSLGYKAEVSALLSCISYTVFSHVIDYVLDCEGYHKSLWGRYLHKHGIDALLEKHGVSVQSIKDYREKEKSLPHLSLRRLVYILQTAMIFKRLSQREAQAILSDIIYDDRRCVFRSLKFARRVGYLALDFTENFWSSLDNAAVYERARIMLDRAFHSGAIDMTVVQHGTDSEILRALKESSDPLIQEMIEKSAEPSKYYRVSKAGEVGGFLAYQKFRGVDPLVVYGNEHKHLSEIDKEFSHVFFTKKKELQKPRRLVLL